MNMLRYFSRLSKKIAEIGLSNDESRLITRLRSCVDFSSSYTENTLGHALHEPVHPLYEVTFNFAPLI